MHVNAELIHQARGHAYELYKLWTVTCSTMDEKYTLKLYGYN